MDVQLSFFNLLNVEAETLEPRLRKIRKAHNLYGKLYSLINIRKSEEVTIYENYYLWHEDSEAEIRGSQFLSDEKKIELHQKEIERLENGIKNTSV